MLSPPSLSPEILEIYLLFYEWTLTLCSQQLTLPSLLQGFRDSSHLSGQTPASDLSTHGSWAALFLTMLTTPPLELEHRTSLTRYTALLTRRAL